MNYSKLNLIHHLQQWMDSVAGQTFLNYAYSWGAAIVILGTLFKLTHLPGANAFLFLGMGTEVVVFFISAFDRPFDKTADGMSLTAGNAASGGTAALLPPTETLRDISAAYLEQLQCIRKGTEVLQKAVTASEGVLLGLDKVNRIFRSAQEIMSMDTKQK